MEGFLLLFAKEMLERDWRTVFVFSGEPSEAFQAKLEDLGCPCIVIAFPLSIGDAKKLGAKLRAYTPIAIQTYFVSKFDAWLLPLKRSAGATVMIVTDQSSGLASRKKGLKKLLARVRSALTSRYIEAVVAVSEFVRNRNVVDVYFPSQKVRLVYNGVDIERFVPLSSKADNAVFTIAFVGQLIEAKGVVTLLESVKILLEKGNQVLVRIAGAGDQLRELQRYCAANKMLDCVEFLGQVDRPEDLYRTADVVVVPSVWEEAFGFVAAEAGACEACLVVPDAGGLPEVVGSNGEAGRVFPRGNARKLAETIEDLILQPHLRRSLGAAARKRVHQMFTLEGMVDGYCNLYVGVGVE